MEKWSIRSPHVMRAEEILNGINFTAVISEFYPDRYLYSVFVTVWANNEAIYNQELSPKTTWIEINRVIDQAISDFRGKNVVQ